jgi:drug/metabolite transporter (DMT)-like permease
MNGPSRRFPSAGLTAMDGLLVLMVIAWGANYSVLKRAFEEVPPAAFNTLRMALASAVFLSAIRIAGRRAGRSDAGRSTLVHTPHPLTTRDRWDLVWLGFVGHCLYQLCFVGGLARTTASNAALIFGTSPVVIAIASAALGHERIGRLHWLGAILSAVGIYFVVGHGAAVGGATVRGDALILAGVACWAVYTIGGSRLMARHSPLFVTGVTMALGTIPYGVLAVPAFLRTAWADVSTTAWLLLFPAALLALNFAYLVWYAAVQKLGPARTSIYSNAIPLIAMITAAIWLGEPITGRKLVGVGAVLTGVVFTRVGTTRAR